MKFTKRLISFVFSTAVATAVFAQTPPPGAVISKTYSGNGVSPITATAGGGKTGLDVNVINGAGTSTVNQGTSNGGSDPWYVQGILGRSWNLSSGSDSVSAVQSGTWSFTLPAGAATSALQTTGNTSLGSIDTKTPALGQALAAGSTPVVLTAAQLSTLTPPTIIAATQSGSWTTGRTWTLSSGTDSVVANAGTNLNTSLLALESGGNLATINGKLADLHTLTQTGTSLNVNVTGGVSGNSSIGTNGTAIPTSSTQVGGSDGTNLRPIKVSATGVVSVDGSAVTQPVSGTVTLGAGTANIGHIDGQGTAGTPSGGVVSVQGVSGGTPQPISGTVTVTPSGTQNVTGTGTAGTPASGVVSVQGISGGQTQATYLTNPTGTANQVRPDAEVRVATDTISQFYDTFDSGSLDTTNRWTVTGTVPTTSAGILTVSAGTTALAFSALQSQPTFPLFGNMYSNAVAAITVDSSLKTGAYRFFGVGTAQASPTVAAPVINGAGFAWASSDGTLSGQVWSAGSMTQTVSLSGVQPTDGLQHRYSVYFKTTRVYFELDNVTVGSIANPNTAVSTLPVLSLVVNGASTVSPAAVFTSSFVGVGDTAGNGRMISDGAFPWRKATVNSNGSLIASKPPSFTVTGAIASGSAANVLNLLSNSATPTSVDGYKSAVITMNGTAGMNGSCIFQESVDNNIWVSAVNYSYGVITQQLNNSGYNTLTGSTAYVVGFRGLFFRVNCSLMSAGTIQAIGTFSQDPFQPFALQVANSTAANLLTTSTISGTVASNITQFGTVNLSTGIGASGTGIPRTTVSNDSSVAMSIPIPIPDVTSAVFNATANTTAFTPTYGSCYQIQIPVTAVSGSPSVDVEVQESRDGSTNWIPVYDLPRITATGSYSTPMIPFTGNRVRYSQTLTGTTSITRAINRLQSSGPCSFIRQVIDRTITLTSLGSTTVNLNAEGQTKNVMLTFAIGADTGLAPVLQLQGSDDAGVIWYPIGSTLTGVASSAVSLTVPNVTAQLFRATVSTAGVGVTPNYVLIRAF